MFYSKRSKCAAAILGIAAVSTMATVALAEPGSGITPVTLVTANLNDDVQENHDRVKLQTKDLTVVRVQELTFGAGSRSGWHHHPGVIVVAVKTGTVTLTDHNCVSKDYGPASANGAVFVEGHDNAQQATSSAGAVVYVTYVVPAANPAATRFRIEDDPPFCASPFRAR